jgi:hypothetical protein
LLRNLQRSRNTKACGLVYREMFYPAQLRHNLILAIPADFWCFRLTWDIINHCHDVKTSCSSFGRNEYVSG